MLRRVGARAWLVELADGVAAGACYRHLAALRERGSLPGVADLVPGARTVLLDGTDGDDLPDRSQLRDLLRDRSAGNAPDQSTRAVLPIPVRYDGEDLDELATLTGLTPAEVVAAHTSVDLTVAFCGFAPGFAYLTGLPERLRVPRRRVPRTRVPAGAVAVAGGYAGIYPRPSPGGWWLLGHTGITLWDVTRPEPALLTPGTRIRFTMARR